MVFAGLALAPVPVRAETVQTYVVGDTLTRVCRAFLNARRAGTGLPPDGALCYAYVVGIADTLSIEGDRVTVSQYLPQSCVPGGMNGNDLAEIVANFLDQKPELRTLGGYFLVRRAFAEKFPCR